MVKLSEIENISQLHDEIIEARDEINGLDELLSQVQSSDLNCSLRDGPENALSCWKFDLPFNAIKVALLSCVSDERNKWSAKINEIDSCLVEKGIEVDVEEPRSSPVSLDLFPLKLTIYRTVK